MAHHAGTRVDHHSGLFLTLEIKETPKIFSSPTIVERAEQEGHMAFGIQELKIQALFVGSWSSVVVRFFQDSDNNYNSKAGNYMRVNYVLSVDSL